MTQQIYTVGQVNHYIKNMFAQDFLLRQIAVGGEVSNCKYHPSGHIYFSLKDESGVLSCVMFAGSRNRGLSFRMKDGDKVTVLGAVRVFERDGRYQLYASEITLSGEGALYAKFAELKRELQEMGMFSPEYKKPIPRYAFRVGIVTASSGAAIRDIQNIAHRRNPLVSLILYPARVQGEGAAETIVRGIETLDAAGVDVIIIGRGGGSIEDLWAFNEESVARAVFACETPVISAVGHETDTTISDFVADLRAPTPSAAAEQAVFDLREALDLIADRQLSLNRRLAELVAQAKVRLAGFDRAMAAFSPMQEIDQRRELADRMAERLQELLRQRLLLMRQRVDESSRQMRLTAEKRLEERKMRLAVYAASMDGLSPLKKLGGGFAYISTPDGTPVRSIAETEPGDPIRVRMKDGSLLAEVREKEQP